MALENLLVYNIISGDTTFPHSGNFTIAVGGQITIDDSNGSGDGLLGDLTNTGGADQPDQDVTASNVAGINSGDLVDSRYQYSYTGSDGSSGTIYLIATNGTANYGSWIVSPTQLDPSVTYTFGTFNRNGAVQYSSLVPCFTSETLIQTDSGETPIDKLRVGDFVKTCRDGLQPLVWVGRRKITAENLKHNPKLRPIRIIAGALGNGLPKRDLLVSPQHRMLVSSKISERMFGETEALISAIKLTALPGIFIDEDVTCVEYFHLLFSKHRVIYAEGAPSESLLTGIEALKALSSDAREEIIAIFPEVKEAGYVANPARYIPKNKLQRKLVERHFNNNQPCLQLVSYSRPS